MGPIPARGARTARVALLTLTLLVLLGIVALGSRSGLGHAAPSRPTPGYVSWSLSVFLIVFVLMIPVALWALFNQERMERRQARSFQARVLRSFVGLALLLLLGLAWAYLRRHGRLPDLHRLFLGSTGGNTSGSKGHRVAPYSPRFEWPVLWASLVLLAACAAGVWWTWRRTGDLAVDEPLEPTVAEALAATIGDAIADLEAEPDARRAVIAAYARMERVLDANGVGRAPSETPLEYLRRVLLELTANGEAAGRLTALFERAKFSHHEIDASMKGEAIDALRELRAGLQASPA